MYIVLQRYKLVSKTPKESMDFGNENTFFGLFYKKNKNFFGDYKKSRTFAPAILSWCARKSIKDWGMV